MTAFTSGIGDVTAGSSIQTRMNMTLPSDFSLVGARAVWELLDGQSHLWNSGDCGDLTGEQSQINPSEKIVSAEANIAIPANIPANEFGSRYQIRYTLIVGTQKLYQFEQFNVQAPNFVSAGAVDALELLGEDIQITINLPAAYDNVQYSLFQGNTAVFAARPTDGGTVTDVGVTYRGTVTYTDVYGASLDPFTVMWSYWNGTDPKTREPGELFIVNPVILDAVREVERAINRAYTDTGINPGTTFEPKDIIPYLRMGRDQFNAAITPTDITMINAIGPFKYFWIGYSIVQAARAQYINEGMKAFDFQGQRTQLTVDRTQYWQSLADAQESQLDEQIKAFKTNLAKRGIIDGDGSNLALRPGAIGSIGITLHGASPFRGGAGTQTPYPLFPFLR